MKITINKGNYELSTAETISQGLNSRKNAGKQCSLLLIIFPQKVSQYNFALQCTNKEK